MADTAFIGALSVALYLAFPPFSDIYRLWRREAGQAIIGGLGAGKFEYPPLAALYFEPLSWLPSSRWAVAVNGVLMVIAAIGVTWLLQTVADHLLDEKPDLRIWVMSPALLFFLPVNWDVAAVFMTVMAVLAVYRKRETTAGALLAAGTSLKVFPGAVVLPLIPLILGWSRRMRFLISGALFLGLGYLAYALIRPDTWDVHLDFARSRSDFEATIWGLLDRVASLFGSQLSLGMVNLFSTVALVLSLLVVTNWAWRKNPSPARVAALALIALTSFNKVFKPQYVLWLLPFLAWLGIRRWKARVYELSAIAQIAVTYFTLPTIIVPIATLIRLLILGALTADTVRKSSNAPLDSAESV